MRSRKSGRRVGLAVELGGLVSVEVSIHNFPELMRNGSLYPSEKDIGKDAQGGGAKDGKDCS